MPLAVQVVVGDAAPPAWVTDLFDAITAHPAVEDAGWLVVPPAPVALLRDAAERGWWGADALAFRRDRVVAEPTPLPGSAHWSADRPVGLRVWLSSAPPDRGPPTLRLLAEADRDITRALARGQGQLERAWVLHDAEGDRVVAHARIGMDRRSLHRAARDAHAKDRALLERLLAGALPTEGPVAAPEPPLRAREAVLGAVRTAARFVRDKARHGGRFAQWQLAVGRGRALAPEAVPWTLWTPPPDRFWADPFVVAHDGEVYVLFEELVLSESHGRLLAARVGEDGSPEHLGTVLAEPFHLSWPQVVHDEHGTPWLVPETGDTGVVRRYRCVTFPTRWEPHDVLLEGVRAYDPTLFRHEGRWWLLAAVSEHGGGTSDTLCAWHAPALEGPWTPHAANPLVQDVGTARPGGPMLRDGSRLLRVSQDCAGDYGRAITLHEVLELTPETYRERVLRRVEPAHGPGGDGVHTLGEHAGWVVMDRRVWTRRRRR